MRSATAEMPQMTTTPTPTGHVTHRQRRDGRCPSGNSSGT